jgi:hypothetical protein
MTLEPQLTAVERLERQKRLLSAEKLRQQNARGVKGTLADWGRSALSDLGESADVLNIIPETIAAGSELVRRGREYVGLGELQTGSPQDFGGGGVTINWRERREAMSTSGMESEVLLAELGAQELAPTEAEKLRARNARSRELSSETISDIASIRSLGDIGPVLDRMGDRHNERDISEQILFGIAEGSAFGALGAAKGALGLGDTPLKRALLKDIATNPQRFAGDPAAMKHALEQQLGVLPEGKLVPDAGGIVPTGTRAQFLPDVSDAPYPLQERIGAVFKHEGTRYSGVLKPIMADPQDMDELIEIAMSEDFARTVANLPGVKNIQKIFNPAAVANNPVSQMHVGRAMLREEGANKASGVFATLARLGNQRKVFGKTDDAGLFAEGPLAGKGLNDIRQFPDKYPLTRQQRQWIDQADAIERAKLDFLKRNGIDINELIFEEGGQYAGRRVVAQMTRDGELIDIGYLGAGPGRLGAKLSASKARMFDTQAEAIAEGYRYMSEEDALFFNLQGAYNAVADKKVTEWLLTKVDFRTTSAPEGFRIAVEQAAHKVDVAENAMKAIQRAKRGEVLPSATLRSIDKAFPEIEGRLSKASKITLDDLVRAGTEAAKPPTVLPVPHAGTLKKYAKLLEEAEKKALANPGNAKLQKEASDLSRKLGFARHRYKLGEPFVIKKNPVKLLKELHIDAMDELLLIVRGKPIKFKTASGKMSIRYEGGLLGDAQILRKEADSKLKSAKEAAEHVDSKEGTVDVLRGKVFEAKLAREIRNTLDPDPRFPFVDAINQYNAIRRFTQLAGDGSMMGIQLIFLPGLDPKIATKAGIGFLRSLVDTKFHANYLAQNQTVVQGSRNLILSMRGNEFTEALARGGLLESTIKIPKKGRIAPLSPVKKILQPFQRGYETALDIAGIELKKAHGYKAMTAEGTQQVDDFINEFRGMSSTARLGVSAQTRQVETLTLLSSRYNRAIASLLFDVFKGNIRGSLARESLLRGVTAISLVAYAISKARGETDSEILEHYNPASPRFFTWEVAGQNIGPGSKVRSVVKLIGESIENPDDLLTFSMKNPAFRFVRGLLSPALTDSSEILSGKNYEGDNIYENPMTFSSEVAKKFMPIWIASSVIDGGDLQGRVTRGLTEFAGGRSYPFSASQRVNEARVKVMEREGLGTDWWDASMTPKLREFVNDDPEVLKALELMADEKLKKGDDYAEYAFERDGINTDAKNHIEGTFNKFGYSEALRNKIDDEQETRADRQKQHRDDNKETLSFFDDIEPRKSVVDQAIVEYRAALNDKNNPWIDRQTGDVDFTKRDEILKQLREETLGEKLFQEVVEAIHLGDPPLVKELRADRQTLKPYFEIKRRAIEAAGPEVVRAYELYLNEPDVNKPLLLGKEKTSSTPELLPEGEPQDAFRTLRIVLKIVDAGEGELPGGGDGEKIGYLKNHPEHELLLYKWGYRSAQKPLHQMSVDYLGEQRLKAKQEGDWRLSPGGLPTLEQGVPQ